MSQQELVIRVVEALERASIDYMITGSLVSSFQGEPRLSHDVDLVVALDAMQIDTVLQAFSDDEFYLSKEAIEAAVRTRHMFNLLQVSSGDKVDFWLLTDSAFGAMRFSRKLQEPLFGRPMYLSTPEDTILQKLSRAQQSHGSEKQFHNALRVFEVQFPLLDFAYLNHWAVELEVDDQLRRIECAAEPI